MNTLTRKVLIEKSSHFWRYPNPSLVPEKLWLKHFNIIQDMFNDTGETKIADKLIHYIAGQILSPLIKEDFTISPIKFVNNNFAYSYRDIIFDNDCYFEVSMNLLCNKRHYQSSFMLKETIEILWEYSMKCSSKFLRREIT